MEKKTPGKLIWHGYLRGEKTLEDLLFTLVVKQHPTHPKANPAFHPSQPFFFFSWSLLNLARINRVILLKEGTPRTSAFHHELLLLLMPPKSSYLTVQRIWGIVCFTILPSLKGSKAPTCLSCFGGKQTYHTQTHNVLYIYLHLSSKLTIHVGKYTIHWASGIVDFIIPLPTPFETLGAFLD